MALERERESISFNEIKKAHEMRLLNMYIEDG